VQVLLTVGAPVRLAVFAYQNIASPAVDTVVTLTGSSSSVVTAGPVQTANAHDLLFIAGSSDYMFAGTFPGYSVRASDPTFIVEDTEVRSTGTFSPMAAPGTNGNWVTQIVALRGF
jgi:hypothetical protein